MSRRQQKELNDSQRILQQQTYKFILDQQVNINRHLSSGYGNMSNVEKQINKADLQAFKEGDSNQYSLIPGLSHSIATRSPNNVTPIQVANGEPKIDSHRQIPRYQRNALRLTEEIAQ